MSAHRRICSAIVALIVSCWGASNASAATSQFRGVNWADPRDNFQSGVIYISGLSSSDTYSSASTVAQRVMGQFVSKLGVNSVRLPINEATVSQYWSTYTGVIDTILSQGTVILCYWSNAHGSKPADMTAFWNMWKTVTTKYGSNSDVYFEPYNEPNAYSKADLGTLYNSWLTQFTSIPKARVILDGTGMAQNVPDIGGDSRFDGCLLAVHEYSMFGSDTWNTEAQWVSHFKGYVGNYADRTVCTEWGGPMSPGSKNGVSYGVMDYSVSPTNYFQAYLRATTSQMCTWNMGSFYWAGLKDNDWYSMTTKTGSGANINLSIPNQSGVDRMRYAWTCSTGPIASSGGSGAGGTSSNAGGASSGGSSSAGGTATLGGSSATGGAKAAGGSTTAAGGTAATTGGSHAAGGAAASGGSKATGGTVTIVVTTGGAVSSGASNATGGSFAVGSNAPSTGGRAPAGTGGGLLDVGGAPFASGGSSSANAYAGFGGATVLTNDAGTGNDSGCGCRTVGHRSASTVFGIWGALGALVLHAARRRVSWRYGQG